MTGNLVLVADHNFRDLSVEREGLADVARIEELDAGDEEAARDQFSRADAVLVRMRELDAETVESMGACRVISRYGIGVDHIDVETATREGIYVTNAPTYCIEEVSIHTIALLLNLARRIKEYDDLVASGGWKSADVFASLPVGRFSEATVGVVGYGSIGRAVAEKLSALGVTPLVCAPSLEPADVADRDVEVATFDDLVRRADYVTVHAPLTDETRGLFSAAEFAAMKPSACLVNASRGPIVDVEALLAAIEAGEIAGAGLDVFPTEPPADDDPLRDHERVITTPHVAYYSEAADVERREQAIENVRTGLRGERPPHAINDP